MITPPSVVLLYLNKEYPSFSLNGYTSSGASGGVPEHFFRLFHIVHSDMDRRIDLDVLVSIPVNRTA